jgi:hypothetical protein
MHPTVFALAPPRSPQVNAIIWVVRLTPLIASIIAGGLAIRGVATGSLIAGGGRSRERRVSRDVEPIQFWVEICLHFIVAIVLLGFGIAAFSI